MILVYITHPEEQQEDASSGTNHHVPTVPATVTWTTFFFPIAKLFHIHEKEKNFRIFFKDMNKILIVYDYSF